MKHVLVTGGSEGLGKATAQKLQQAGFAVTILSNDEQQTAAAAQELGCAHVVADVSDYAAVEAAFAQAVEQAAPIDILINNAGMLVKGALDANTPEEIRRIVEVNTLGTMYCTRAVMPAMKNNGQGRIINIVSVRGKHPKANRGPYVASKYAVAGFTRAMQYELKPFNIAVTGVYPGAMDTRIFAKAGDTDDHSNALDPSVVADTIVYLCRTPDGVVVPEIDIEKLDLLD